MYDSMYKYSWCICIHPLGKYSSEDNLPENVKPLAQPIRRIP